MKRKRALRQVVQAAGIPEDIVLGMPRVLLRGDSVLLLENHRGVVEYGPERLRVSTALGMLVIVGKGLTLSTLGEEDLMLTGAIQSVTFGEGGRKIGLV
ncbi:MAG: sporulation protein YqfC [Firmicutes bacterium]|nr:sporulation protein YqfC [Bacillota bacterium]